MAEKIDAAAFMVNYKDKVVASLADGLRKCCLTCGSSAGLALCTGCNGSVVYCSRSCQITGWKSHKQRCRRIAICNRILPVSTLGMQLTCPYFVSTSSRNKLIKFAQRFIPPKQAALLSKSDTAGGRASASAAALNVSSLDIEDPSKLASDLIDALFSLAFTLHSEIPTTFLRGQTISSPSSTITLPSTLSTVDPLIHTAIATAVAPKADTPNAFVKSMQERARAKALRAAADAAELAAANGETVAAPAATTTTVLTKRLHEFIDMWRPFDWVQKENIGESSPFSDDSSTFLHLLANTIDDCAISGPLVGVLKTFKFDLNVLDHFGTTALDRAILRDSGLFAIALIYQGASLCSAFTSDRQGSSGGGSVLDDYRLRLIPITHDRPWGKLNYRYTNILLEAAFKNAGDIIRAFGNRCTATNTFNVTQSLFSQARIHTFIDSTTTLEADTPLLVAVVMNSLDAAQAILEILSGQGDCAAVGNEEMQYFTVCKNAINKISILNSVQVPTTTTTTSTSTTAPKTRRTATDAPVSMTVDLTVREMSMSALSAAVDAGYPKMVKLLLDYGGDPNQMECTRKSILAHALLCGMSEGGGQYARYFHDSEPELIHHKKALERLTARERYIKCARKLAHAGANVLAVNGYGWAILHYAVCAHDLKTLNLILKLGAYKDVCTATIQDAVQSTNEHYGMTPLMLATNLHKLGDDDDTTDPNCYSIVQLLVSYGASSSINAVNSEGFTALHFAALNGFTGTARLLIKCGAYVHARNKQNNTPFDLLELFRYKLMSDPAIDDIFRAHKFMRFSQFLKELVEIMDATPET